MIVRSLAQRTRFDWITTLTGRCEYLGKRLSDLGSQRGVNVVIIIGCDFHPGFEQVAIFDNVTGEIQEKKLLHRGEAEQFYRSLSGQPVRVGMEACGHYPWFERLLGELGFELWLGDAAQIRAKVVRKQKTDRLGGPAPLAVVGGERFSG